MTWHLYSIIIIIIMIHKWILYLFASDNCDLTLWSFWCVAKSWADQTVNEGRINTSEASEILILEFRGVFTPTAGSLWSESGDELATRRLSPIGLISNCPANENPPTKSLVAAVARSLAESLFPSVNTEQHNLHLLITAVIIWTKYQAKIIQKNDTFWKDFKATSR